MPVEILGLRNIVHHFDGRRVLDVPYLTIEKGRVYSVVGPNGSGKSTLLSIMGLLLQPSHGEVYFEGRPVRYEPESLMAMRESVTMALQNPYLFNTSVGKNVAYGLRSRGVPWRDCEANVRDALELVGLRGFEKRRAQKLSGGETQLVALARAVVLEPSVLLLDEPTANLDTRHVHRFESLVSRINSERGTTVVVTTHNLSQAYRFTERVFSLFEGALVAPTMFNLFSGKVIHTEEGPCFDTGKTRIWVVAGTEAVNATHLSIDPQFIIASEEPFTSSARNQFDGRVTGIVDQGGKILLKVRSKENFTVEITDQSLRAMRLTVGSKVYLTFKASSVHLL